MSTRHRPQSSKEERAVRAGDHSGAAASERAEPVVDMVPEPVAGGTSRRKLALLVGVGAAAVALGGGAWAVRAGGSGEAPAETAEAKRDAPFLDGNFIRFSEAFAKRNGVTTLPVKPQDLEPIVGVTGTVSFDTRKFAAVGARIPGRIRRVFKVVGDSVAPQQPLAEIESAELGRAEALVAGARAKEHAAEAEMKRERQLADAKVSAERDAEAAKASFEAARAERIAAERAVQALGGDLDSEIGIFILRSPIAGKIVSAKVARGQTVDPTDTVYEVADLSSVWVELRVFERDLPGVRSGDEVEIVPQGGPARALKGKVDYVGEVVDVESRTAAVRVVVDNKERFLRPGQSVHARIHTEGPVGNLLAVPRAAVTRVDGKPTVLVLVADGTVEPRAIKLGPEDRENAAVVEGLKEGEKVIVGGLFALKSEIFR